MEIKTEPTDADGEPEVEGFVSNITGKPRGVAARPLRYPMPGVDYGRATP